MKKIISLGVILGATPLFAFAATGVTAFSILGIIAKFLGYIIPVLITLAVVYFIWGVLSFILSSDEEAKKSGRAKIINGLIGLFIIIAFWGVISLVTTTFGVGAEQLRQQDIPCIPNPAAGINCYR